VPLVDIVNLSLLFRDIGESVVSPRCAIVSFKPRMEGRKEDIDLYTCRKVTRRYRMNIPHQMESLLFSFPLPLSYLPSLAQVPITSPSQCWVCFLAPLHWRQEPLEERSGMVGMHDTIYLATTELCTTIGSIDLYNS